MITSAPLQSAYRAPARCSRSTANGSTTPCRVSSMPCNRSSSPSSTDSRWGPDRQTPFGVPVVPEVKVIKRVSAGIGAGILAR